jgi:hypothetical protein
LADNIGKFWQTLISGDRAHRIIGVLQATARAFIEKLATSDEVTLTVERLPEGKMRVASSGWDAERVFAPDQVLEVRWVSGRLHVARKERHHDEWDRPVEAYDPYGPRVVVLDDVIGLQEPVTHHSDDVTEA